MEIFEIIWMARFAEKIERKHGVSVHEVEQVFANPPRIKRLERGDVKGEDLYRALGKTDTERYLAVFFIYKKRGSALVISAREMTRQERNTYGKSQD